MSTVFLSLKIGQKFRLPNSPIIYMRFGMLYSPTSMRDPLHDERIYEEKNTIVIEGTAEQPAGTTLLTSGWTQVEPV